MKYRFLIVDDEDLIRQGIVARLKYLNLMPMEVFEAGGGIEAMELLKEQEVDIIITDIRMDDMDGLVLIKQAKLIKPRIQFIIISGYAEFAYAEQAIQLGVKAYLLKPISNDELKKTLEEVMSNIEEEEYLKKTLTAGTRSMVENQVYIFEKNVNDLLRNNEGVQESKKFYDVVNKEFPMDNKWVILGVVNVDGDSYEKNEFNYRDIELIQFSIKNVFSELQSQADKIIVNNLANLNQMFVVLSTDNKQYLRSEAERIFTQLQNKIWEYMSLSLTIGISSARKVLSFECTKEAQEAFLQRMIHGNSNLYFYNDIKCLSVNKFPTSELNMLRLYIERHDAGNIEFLINNIFSDEQIKQYNTNYIRIIWARVIGILLKHSNTTFTNTSKNTEKLILNYEVLDSFRSLEELRDFLYSLILECIQLNLDVDLNSKNKIKLAIKYITDNYNQDIAVNDLSERFSMSPNYFSTVFKRETGQTTVNYLKELRLKKACEYLMNSDKSVVDIAKEVGYEDSQYFFRVFKKATGQTPLQYRRFHNLAKD